MKLSRVSFDHAKIAQHSAEVITEAAILIVRSHGWRTPSWFVEPCGCVHVLPNVHAAETLRAALYDRRATALAAVAEASTARMH